MVNATAFSQHTFTYTHTRTLFLRCCVLPFCSLVFLWKIAISSSNSKRKRSWKAVHEKWTAHVRFSWSSSGANVLLFGSLIENIALGSGPVYRCVRVMFPSLFTSWQTSTMNNQIYTISCCWCTKWSIGILSFSYLWSFHKHSQIILSVCIISLLLSNMIWFNKYFNTSSGTFHVLAVNEYCDVLRSAEKHLIDFVEFSETV